MAKEYSLEGFLSNLGEGIGNTVTGLASLVGGLGADVAGETKDLFTSGNTYSSETTQNVFSLDTLKGIGKDYADRYGMLLPGGRPAGEFGQEAYKDPFSYLLDVGDLVGAGLAGKAAKGKIAKKASQKADLPFDAEDLDFADGEIAGVMDEMDPLLGESRMWDAEEAARNYHERQLGQRFEGRDEYLEQAGPRISELSDDELVTLRKALADDPESAALLDQEWEARNGGGDPDNPANFYSQEEMDAMYEGDPNDPTIPQAGGGGGMQPPNEPPPTGGGGWQPDPDEPPEVSFVRDISRRLDREADFDMNRMDPAELRKAYDILHNAFIAQPKIWENRLGGWHGLYTAISRHLDLPETQTFSNKLIGGDWGKPGGPQMDADQRGVFGGEDPSQMYPENPNVPDDLSGEEWGADEYDPRNDPNSDNFIPNRLEQLMRERDQITAELEHMEEMVRIGEMDPMDAEEYGHQLQDRLEMVEADIAAARPGPPMEPGPDPSMAFAPDEVVNQEFENIARREMYPEEQGPLQPMPPLDLQQIADWMRDSGFGQFVDAPGGPQLVEAFAVQLEDLLKRGIPQEAAWAQALNMFFGGAGGVVTPFVDRLRGEVGPGILDVAGDPNEVARMVEIPLPNEAPSDVDLRGYVEDMGTRAPTEGIHPNVLFGAGATLPFVNRARAAFEMMQNDPSGAIWNAPTEEELQERGLNRFRQMV